MNDEGDGTARLPGPPIEPPPAYSTAYAEIVGDEDDLINMVAYCLYKKQKREFIIKNGLPFSDQRVRHYHDDLSGERIDTLRVAARARLQAYANIIQESVRAEEGEDIRRGTIVATLTSALDASHRQVISTVKNETAWWKAVLYSIVGGFALGLIIVAASRMGFMNPFDALPAKTSPAKTSQAPPGNP